MSDVQLDEDWADLIPKLRSGSRGTPVKPGPVLLPPLDKVLSWAHAPYEDTQRAYVVFSSPVLDHRLEVYREVKKLPVGASTHTIRFREWIGDGLLKSFQDGVGLIALTSEAQQLVHSEDGIKWLQLHPGYEWLWGLVVADELILDDTLQNMVDQPHYLVHEVYRALWELRFRAKEEGTPKVQEDFKQMVRWLNGTRRRMDDEVLSRLQMTRWVTSTQERFDVWMFLLSLAKQSDLLTRVLFFAGEAHRVCQRKRRARLRELYTLMGIVARWNKITDCPAALMVGFDGDYQSIIEAEPKLEVLFRRGSKL
jgi:hypothetical protein